MTGRRERQGGQGDSKQPEGGGVCLQQMLSSEFREKAALRRKPGRSSAVQQKLHESFHLCFPPHLRCCSGEARSPASALQILQAAAFY